MKIITLFVFAKIEIYCSQNMEWIGIISTSAAYELRADEPSLNSYIQDFLIFLTITA